MKALKNKLRVSKDKARSSDPQSHGEASSSALSPSSQESPEPFATTPASTIDSRRPSAQSSVFGIPVLLSHESRKLSVDRRLDPMGLTVLHTPENVPTADVVFLHGLGGTSRHTWSQNRDLKLFWPKEWLPFEPVIATARITTFGYNADFLSGTPNAINRIADFAKSLLFEMKFGKDNEVGDLNMGQRPIIFVAHSMGGLVFKKALILGLSDTEYKEMASNIEAILFLSTPHRGTDLADILNRILSASIFNHSPKQYINELKRDSPTIEDINETFRHHASRLKMFSFYETLQTPVGIRNMMILDRHSSTLGYPGEITDSIQADHHNICKFSAPDDPSYKKIRGVLKTLITAYLKNGSKAIRAGQLEDMKKISEMLSTTSAPDDNLVSLLDRWKEGTCEGILSEASFISWLNGNDVSQILWLSAHPGSGKSVKMAFIVNHLQNSDALCSYFFFKDGDATRISAGSLLRSLAFQIACQVPVFRELLILADESGLKVDKMEARMIWEKFFLGGLFKLDPQTPLYWVIDALDESENYQKIIGFLSKLSLSKTPIRVLVSSRMLPEIEIAFRRISVATIVVSLVVENNEDDLQLYSEKEMEYVHGNALFKRGVIEEIVTLAEGNFLWASLALKEIVECYTPDDVKNVLAELPPGMDALYKRMETAIRRLKKPSDLLLSQVILSWATYSRRPLHIDELLHAMLPDHSQIFDLKYAISQLCGHFVTVDANDHVFLVHQTAREYLVSRAELPFPFSAHEIQEQLLRTTLNLLSDLRQRARSKRLKPPPLYEYAATSWPHHLTRSTPGSDDSLTRLMKFFSEKFVLTWIYDLAEMKQLRVLVSAATALKKFISQRKAQNTTLNPVQHRLREIDFLEHWAVDLLKIVGKFGGHLVQDPTSITKYVPQFCPRGSAIFQQFGDQTEIQVQGLPENQEWDDCLAQVTVGDGLQALKLACSSQYVAVSTSGGTAVLWDAETFEEVRTLYHNEHIFTMCFTDRGEFLATYGHRTTKIWAVSTGRVLHTIRNYPECRALSMKFVEGKTKLFVGLNTRKVAEWGDDTNLEEWTTIGSSFLHEDTTIPGAFLNSPTAMAFNSDVSFVLVAYRAFPLTMWKVEDRHRVAMCLRQPFRGQSNALRWSGVTKIIWHTNDEDALGIYSDGIVFKWNPFNDTHQELPSDSDSAPLDIQCSPNGSLFATCDVDGFVKLYNFQYFSLIYRLSSEDIITGLCFSADSKLFLDLRGSYCKVWAPNALVQLMDQDDRDSDRDAESGSIQRSNNPSEAFATPSAPITALAVSPQGLVYCTGDSTGVLELHDTSTHKRIEICQNSRSGMSIITLTWSEGGTRLAYSDGESMTVMAVHVPEQIVDASPWTCSTIFDVEIDLDKGMLRQIILHPKSDQVLVVLENAVQLWSTSTKSLLLTKEASPQEIWLCHPINKDLLIAFALNSVATYFWDTLQISRVWKLETSMRKSSSHDHQITTRPALKHQQTSTFSDPFQRSHQYIDEVNCVAIQKYFLVLISEEGAARRRWSKFQILKTDSFKDDDEISNSVTPISVPEEISQTVQKPFGILENDRLVFLDKSFWVCSWLIEDEKGKDIENAAKSIKRHFFLPRYWANAEMVRICRLMVDGAILCPRDGEVAVITSSLEVM